MKLLKLPSPIGGGVEYIRLKSYKLRDHFLGKIYENIS